MPIGTSFRIDLIFGLIFALYERSKICYFTINSLDAVEYKLLNVFNIK